MKIVITIFLLCVVPIESYAQNKKITSSTIDTLYVRALNKRFDMLLSSGNKYIEPTEQSKRIKNRQVSDLYKFLSSKALTRLSLREQTTIRLIRIGHKIVSNDTIDINFANVGYTAKEVIDSDGRIHTNIDIAISCGGTNGYQPSMRFVFDKIKKEWILIYNSSIDK